jgi:hypothetical protein
MARIRVGQREYNRAYYAANRNRIRAQQSAYGYANRSRLVAARKGLTAERVQALLEAQGGRCAICPSYLTVPHIDHDHSCCPGPKSCGECVRGLLCASCNHMLGKARDKPEVLEAAARYLRQFSEGGQ